MQRIIDQLDEILEGFDEKAPMGHRFHTPTRQDFVALTKCVKQMAEQIQNEGIEID
jgi:hypothetical protein